MNPDSLVSANLPLARGMAAGLKARHGLSIPVEDLEGYAMAGLVEAAARFDPARGVPFEAYARYRITGAMWDGVRQMGWRPRRRHRARFEERSNDYLEAAAVRDQEKDPALALSDRASDLAVIFIASLDLTPETSSDAPSARDRMELHQLRVGLRRAIDKLPPREQTIMRGLYGEGRSMKDVAAALGLSLSWTSRLHTQTIQRLRRLLRTQGLLS